MDEDIASDVDIDECDEQDARFGEVEVESEESEVQSCGSAFVALIFPVFATGSSFHMDERWKSGSSMFSY